MTYRTPKQIATELGVKPSRVIAWMRAGELVGVNVGDGRRRPRFRISETALAEFLERRTVCCRPRPPARRGPRRREEVIQFFK
jgi:hypothetical protein